MPRRAVASVEVTQRSVDKNRPREKLQSQLNTQMPMEIVRNLPFFHKNTLFLRDQIEEYVHGFPATMGHRKIIAKQFNVDVVSPPRQRSEDPFRSTQPVLSQPQ